MARSKFSYKEKVLQSDTLEATCDVSELNLVFHVLELNYLWDFCTGLMRGHTNSRRQYYFQNVLRIQALYLLYLIRLLLKYSTVINSLSQMRN